VKIRSFDECSIAEAQECAQAMIVACGYEQRSRGITSLVEKLPPIRTALCFEEFSTILARPSNESFFRQKGFTLETVGSNQSQKVQSLFDGVIRASLSNGSALLLDISTMTRSWHGALVRQLRIAEYGAEITTFFAYTPSVFRQPRAGFASNEFVAPVEGFAALTTPEYPVAAIIGLGYEKEEALGLQQLLDPSLTILFKPTAGQNDKYYKHVLANNREILARTPEDCSFDYRLDSPAETLSNFASLVNGLRNTHRVVLASLGPKMFGLMSFLIATQFPEVSVWRVSSGVHGQPRDSVADLKRATILKVVWQPSERLAHLR
jgi:hypothetical protein